MTTSYNVDTLKDINLNNVGIGELKNIAKFLDIKRLYTFNNKNKEELIKLVDDKINKNDTKKQPIKKKTSPKGEKTLLPCPNKDEERNPKTGRCRKRCTPEQERNPAGKCVKKKTPPKKQKTPTPPSPPKNPSLKGEKTLLPCPNKDEERNPKTGRCRKRCTPEQERNHAGKCVKRKKPPIKQKTPSPPTNLSRSPPTNLSRSPSLPKKSDTPKKPDSPSSSDDEGEYSTPPSSSDEEDSGSSEEDGGSSSDEEDGSSSSEEGGFSSDEEGGFSSPSQYIQSLKKMRECLGLIA